VIVTIGTNVWVSGVFFGGTPDRALSAAREGVFTPKRFAEHVELE
jgi:hypothetical protein